MLESVDELRTFRRIVDEGSLSAAARSLGISLNAVSRRLAQLEGRLGVSLATRTTRRFALTDEGQRFAARCRDILDAIEQAEEEVRPASAGLSGLVRVSVYPDMLRGELLGALQVLLDANPKLRLHMVARSLGSDPQREGLDLVVWPGEITVQSVIAKRVIDIQWVFACSVGYAERHGVPKSPDDLRDHHCLRALKGRTENVWSVEAPDGQMLEAPVAGQFESDDNDALRAALYAGLGIGVRPRTEVLQGVAEGRLVHVLPEYRWFEFPVYLVSPPGRLRLARVRAVANLLEDAIRALA